MTFADIVANIINILEYVILAIIAIAVAGFMYGLVGYLANSGNEEKRKDSINYIIAGIVGLFVMFAIWGIVALVANSFGVGIGIPQIR